MEDEQGVEQEEQKVVEAPVVEQKVETPVPEAPELPVQEVEAPVEPVPEKKSAVPTIAGAGVKEEVKEVVEEKKEEPKKEGIKTHIFALRTTANREDQVMDFLVSNIKKKKWPVFAVIRPHGMRGYIFVEANDRQSAEEASFNIPYARGILPKEIQYSEIEHMLEQVKREVDIRKNDIVEIIAGPFKREQAKVTRIDKSKEEVVVELLGAAVPIPITVKLDAVKVIRRESEPSEEKEES
ncbi:transcription elongation factor Spt5 [Candidatus Woesearchaeota archaeon]|nr:transcription elongation factor Spt5 [Candidatus Woesearchaeota archaeon]